jgi:hypothetical protein
MRVTMLLCAIAALLLLPIFAGAQFVVFTDEGQFFNAIQSPTTIEFEEVADDDSITITDQTGAFTRESVAFQVTDNRGNPAFGQVLGRDFIESIGLPAYNMGSGDFFQAVSEFPVVIGMNFEGVAPEAVGFRVDDQRESDALSVVLRTTLNNQIETHNFAVDTTAGVAFFGFASTNHATILDVTVTGDVDNRAPSLNMDRVTYAPISTVPGPAALPIFGAGLAALGFQIRRRRA